LQESLETLFRLAGEEDDPQIERLLQFRRQFLQHRHATADMEPADGDWHALGSKLPRDSHRARKLVGLDPRQAYDAGVARALDAFGDLFNRNPDVHLVIGVDLDGDVLAQDAAFSAILRDGVDGSHGIRGNPGLPPLNDIAVLVVMGRFDDFDVKCRDRPLPQGHSFGSNYTRSRLRRNE
jgi:hypothetical protein